MGLPRSDRHMFQGDQGKTTDANVTGGNRIPLTTPMAGAHILARWNHGFEPQFNSVASVTGLTVKKRSTFLAISVANLALEMGDGLRFQSFVLICVIGQTRIQWRNGGTNLLGPRWAIGPLRENCQHHLRVSRDWISNL